MCSVLLQIITVINTDVSYFVALQSPYNHEIQQDTRANSQVHGVYGPPVRPPFGGVQQTVVSGSFEQHRAAAAATSGVHQPSSSPSPDHQLHSGQQMPEHRPVYVSTVPSAVPQGQPASVSFSQPAVSLS